MSIQTGVPDGREFVLRLTPPAEFERCPVLAYQTGSFGGYGAYCRPGVWGRACLGCGLALPAGRAETLKVSVCCRAYGLALVSIPALFTSSLEAAVPLVPLAEASIRGRVLPSADGVSLAGATLRVVYEPGWLCGFFGLSDCLTPIMEIASGFRAD